MFNFLVGVKLNKKINKKLKLVKNTQNIWPQLDMDVHNKTVQLTLQIKLENSYFNYKKKKQNYFPCGLFCSWCFTRDTVDRVVFN